MKKVSILIAILICAGLLFGNIKFGYYNSVEIYEKSERVKVIQKEFEDIIELWKEQIFSIESEIEELSNQLRTKEAILSDSRKNELKTEIQKKMMVREENYNQIFGPQGMAAQKEAELLQPVMEQLTSIVDKIGIDDNYDVIFDYASGMLPYVKEKYDITQRIIEEFEKDSSENNSEK